MGVGPEANANHRHKQEWLSRRASRVRISTSCLRCHEEYSESLWANRQIYIKIGNNVALLKFQQLLGTVRRFNFCSCCTIKMLFFMLKVYSTGKQCRFLSNLPWISLEMPSTTADSLCVWESTAPTEQLMTCITCNWWTKTKIFNWCGGGIDLH